MSSQNPRSGEDPERPLDRRTTARPRGERIDEVSDLPDEREMTDTSTSRSREPGQGLDDPIRFDGDDNVPPRETESAGPAPMLATGMFLPVVILAIIAIVLIVWFVL